MCGNIQYSLVNFAVSGNKRVSDVSVSASGCATVCLYLGLHHAGHPVGNRTGDLPEGSGISGIFLCCELFAGTSCFSIHFNRSKKQAFCVNASI